MSAKIQVQDGKVKWNNSKCLFLTKNCWESMEEHLNPSGFFPRIFFGAGSSRDPELFAKTELRTCKFTDWIIFVHVLDKKGK